MIFKGFGYNISHNKLLIQLFSYCICGKKLGLIKDFLTARSFNVALNNSNSRHYPVTSFVLHGSTLGPLLYILYGNNPVNKFKFANTKKYAVDFIVYAKINSEVNMKQLKLELNNFCNWVYKTVAA